MTKALLQRARGPEADRDDRGRAFRFPLQRCRWLLRRPNPKSSLARGVAPKQPAPTVDLIKKVPALQPYADSIILARPSVDLAGLASDAKWQIAQRRFQWRRRVVMRNVLRWDRDQRCRPLQLGGDRAAAWKAGRRSRRLFEARQGQESVLCSGPVLRGRGSVPEGTTR